MRPDAILQTLERAGFEARYVGGCVRDTLLGRPVHDWDIARRRCRRTSYACSPAASPPPGCSTAR